VKRVVALAVVASAAATARASTVIALSPAELYAGADRVVDATVIARWTTWGSTLETHAVLDDGSEVVVAGGALDGVHQIVVGMPSVDVGERARWFLRARGDGTYRVYGWAQGKWPARVVDGVATFAPDPVLAEHDARFIEFTTNGMQWPAAKIPVQYLVNTTPNPDVAFADEVTAIDAAFATWGAVAC
jgi:hypothetical protein